MLPLTGEGFCDAVNDPLRGPVRGSVRGPVRVFVRKSFWCRLLWYGNAALSSKKDDRINPIGANNQGPNKANH